MTSYQRKERFTKMTAWSEMQAAEFDRQAAGKRERAIIETAPATLFPRLLPSPSRKATPAAVQLPGQDSLFGEEA